MNGFGKIQHMLARRAVRKHFACVRCAGLENLRALPAGQAWVLCPVHTSWWDGFFAACLMPSLPGRELRIVQEAQHLRKYPWFHHAGVLGLDATSVGKLRQGLRQLRHVLENPATIMVYFPQGKLVLQDGGPIRIKRGIGQIVQSATIPVVPIVWRHGLREGVRPDVWMRIGRPIYAVHDPLTESLENDLQALDQQVAADWAMSAESAYQPLWHPALPIHEVWWQIAKKSGLATRFRG